MGTCMSRCWPSYPDHRYIPVRSRYLRHEETVQLELIVTREDQPRRLSTLTSSSSLSTTSSSSSSSFSDVSLCLEGGETPNRIPESQPGEGARDGLLEGILGGVSERVPILQQQRRVDDDDPLLNLSPEPVHDLNESPSWTVCMPVQPEQVPSMPMHVDSPLSNSLLQVSPSEPSSPVLTTLCHHPLRQAQYYSITSQEDDEIVLASNHDQEEEEEDEDGEDQEAYEESPLPVRRTSSRLVTIGVTGKRWGIRGTPGSSLPSLTEPDSPPTTSLDLEWEPEAGLVRMSRESLGEEEGSHTAESNSWVARSSCSTPNSLEWDFRASTLSLRGGIEDDSWQHTDMETEQLLHEIEQLAARALADTGHGLQAAPR
ncbi:uncharacterized protein LOC135217318 isoform X2 [Macrobrachium nipponense]|uniref:uncharacterized protein LOC135217318 isoform X2 n=1 Tax=Macrobrachium nipponense TaxID=159736 RepID=UPI0030C89916